MPRALVLGNGQILVCLDQFGFVRDFYFPYVGLENHVAGNKHRIGVRVNGVFSWLDDGSWQISLGYKSETMVGYLVCKNEKLQLSLVMEDIVYNESNVFLRKVNVYNHSEQAADIKLFFHQVFLINENPKRNTAFYDPTHNVIVHYKGRRVFVVNGRTVATTPDSELAANEVDESSSDQVKPAAKDHGRDHGIDDFSVGAYNFEGKEGTYRDAEDGELGKNGVEHGSVDSVVRLCLSCQGKAKATAYYWLCVGKSLDEAYGLNAMVEEKTPQGMINSTESFWNAWLNKRALHLDVLPPEQKKLFETSLFILRAHTDNRGAIIASADSSMIEHGKDDYAYMWPRDAAYIALVLDKAGFTEVTKPFFQFCCEVLHPDGYVHHRFNADKSLGSTWHSNLVQKEWLQDKILQLPIQEDETAAIIFALWNHYEVTKDVEFIEGLYKPLIEKAANFLVHFRHPATGLPLPSYDLWEEKMGVSTYTCAAVYGGLMAAANFSELLGKRNHMREYKDAAREIKKATQNHLFSSTLNSFMRLVTLDGDQVLPHEIVDASSLFGLWYFGLLSQDDPQFKATHEQVLKRLTNPLPAGGIIRYESDGYFRTGSNSNPWFITTLWEAQRRLSAPQVTADDLKAVEETLSWVTKHMYPSGVLSEQLQPETGAALSATPLAWSHAVLVETIMTYLDKMHELGLCPKCGPALVPSEL